MSFSTTIEVGIASDEREVVPMHDAPRIQPSMVETARGGLASGEPEALGGLRVKRLPTGRGGTSAVKTAPELGAHPRLGHLRRERHIHVLIDVRMQ
eukprot:15465492-Alexandrium_andersonii.AAC.1